MFLAVLLVIHSWVRWLVVVALLVAGGRAAHAVVGGRRAWGDADLAIARSWVGVTDIQALVGLTLYLTASPMAAIARQDATAAWASWTICFFGFIHPALMIGYVAVTHGTWIAVRRTDDATLRFRRLLVGGALALVLLSAAIPWPFLSHGRPLFRP